MGLSMADRDTAEWNDTTGTALLEWTVGDVLRHSADAAPDVLARVFAVKSD